jgi:hypothetical protein
MKVELEPQEHFFHRVSVSVVYRSVAGHSRPYGIQTIVTAVVLHYLIDEILALRTRPDERHIASQHIPELRQFVKMVCSEPCANACEAFVAVKLEQMRTIILCVWFHRAEFQYVERLAMHAYSLLPVYFRAMIFTLYEYVEDKKQWREDNKSQC